MQADRWDGVWRATTPISARARRSLVSCPGMEVVSGAVGVGVLHGARVKASCEAASSFCELLGGGVGDGDTHIEGVDEDDDDD